MKKIILLLLLALFFSCNQDPKNEKYENKSVENKYSLLIPETLSQTDQLNSIASIQFQSTEQDFYIMVIEEVKDNFAKAIQEKKANITPDLEGYYNVITKHFEEITKDFKIYDLEKKRINSSNAIVFSMSGINDDYPVFYRYAIIESDKTFYQIMSWTNTSQEKKYIDRMNKIIDSFDIEEANYSKKSHLAKDKTKENSGKMSTSKLDKEIQAIANLYRPEMMKQEKIEIKNGKSNYQYTLFNSDLLDNDLKNTKNYSRTIAGIYYSFLKRINSPFSYNKIIIKIVHRNGAIDNFEYSEKDMTEIVK
ncbi:hypothetical protein HYN56_21165 [Flavobacterium crocinum]|uniref:Uncharacterized protein n=1 Tax=Flavobacterium crocinum TaxID=2183896 RepID=A0A2S1YRF0_9FLAO|nr:hypothetical protein [Flavobacterium crocinum]AWK06603.1 hypothetical protein HYN56_21165 [Flavobacterium crocinum]